MKEWNEEVKKKKAMTIACDAIHENRNANGKKSNWREDEKK